MRFGSRLAHGLFLLAVCASAHGFDFADVSQRARQLASKPYENPKYAYAVVMERASKNNQFGAVLVMQDFFNGIYTTAPEYLN